jgi:hypothetical protein
MNSCDGYATSGHGRAWAILKLACELSARWTGNPIAASSAGSCR